MCSIWVIIKEAEINNYFLTFLIILVFPIKGKSSEPFVSSSVVPRITNQYNIYSKNIKFLIKNKQPLRENFYMFNLLDHIDMNQRLCKLFLNI